MKRYKGYTISNISETPMFPFYGIFDPKGELVSTTIFGSTGLKDYVDGLNKKV